MMGSASDADDLVQQTFERTLSASPAADRPIRPWLARVAMNLAKDALRARRRHPYPGSWLPEPVESEEDFVTGIEVPGTEGRYELLETVSFAFLLALEALTPNQRAVLLLRDMLAYDVAETAEVLGLSATNVKVTLHRARAAMAEYDKSRIPTSSEVSRAVLAEFLAALSAGDSTTLERLLREDVRVVNDGGGEVFAGRRPVVGRAKAMLFLKKLSARRGLPTWAEIRSINGSPALVAAFDAGRHANDPRRVVSLLRFDAHGRIAESFWVVAPSKLRPRVVGALES
jgi:RNA polymerase sigma-70 factor (ECF subfamily)